MATVQKGAKLNFYKFVQVKEPSGGTAAVKTDSNVALTKAINTNTRAINNLGDTVNSFAKIVADIKKVSIIQLELEEKNRKKFEAKYNKTQKGKFGKAVESVAGKAGSFLDGLLDILGGLFKLGVVAPILKWLGDEKNQKTIKTVLDVIGKVAKFIFDWAKFGVTNTIDGLYNLLRDDATWQDRLLGLGQAIVGIGTVLLGVRYLSNPLKLIGDITRGVRALIGFVTGGGRRPRTPGGPRRRNRLGGAARFLTGAVVTGAAGYGLYQSFQEPEYAKGGKVKKASAGGWINGPQSGYPVSLDGGRSTSFIGHGKEYVARKADGGAFVVPFNTPATQTQPHLTQNRISEAKRLGYSLPGFASGGQYLKDVKANDATQGSNANKKIFLHWSAGSRYGTNFYNGHGYHTYIDGSGQPVRRAKFGQRGVPHHTYGRDKASSAAIGVAGMSTASEGNYSSWGSEAITPGQYKGMAKEAAAIATAWGWKPSDITDKRVRTHSEEYRDYPNWYHRNNSSHYRWDLNRLYAGDQKNTGGNKIRSMIKQQMAGFGNSPTATDAARDGHKPRPWNRWLGIADALTGNVFNLDGVPRGGSNPSTAQSNAAASDEAGKDPSPGVKGNLQGSNTQKWKAIWAMAKKAGAKYPNLVAAQFALESAWGTAISGKNNFFGIKATSSEPATTHRTREVINGQSVYVNARFKDFATPQDAVNHLVTQWYKDYRGYKGVNNAGSAAEAANMLKSEGYATDPQYAASLKRLMSEYAGIEGTEADAANAGSLNSTSSGSSDTGADIDSGTTSEPSLLVLGAHSQRGMDEDIYSNSDASLLSYRKQYGYDTATGIQSMPGETELKSATDQRNQAKTEIDQSTRDMVTAAVEIVGQQNIANSQVVAQATQSIQQIAAHTGPKQPQFVPTQGGISGAAVGGAIGGPVGAAIGGTTAAILNSFNNPLKGIFR